EALAVADVQGEPQRRWVAEETAQVVEVGEGAQEVAGFGFHGEGDAGGVGRLQDGGEGPGEALPPGVLVGALGQDAAEAVDGVRTQVGGDPDGPQEEVDAPGPVVRGRVGGGGTVLAAGAEDVAGAGLDGAPGPGCVQPPGDPVGAGGQVRGEGVEVHVVEGQADSVVAEVGEQTEGVVETEIGEAVGAVADTHGDGRPRARLCD